MWNAQLRGRVSNTFLIKYITGLDLVTKDPLTNNTSNSETSHRANIVEGESAQSLVSRNIIPGKVAEAQQLSSHAAPSYKEKLYKETIELMTEGVFSLAEICKVVSILSRFEIPEDPVGPSSKQHCLADKFVASL